MTWYSLSFIPNNMSCFCSIRSEICGFSRVHKLAAGPKILLACCKRVARTLNSKMWSHFEPSHSGCKLCHVKAHTCTELWHLLLQSAASPSVCTSMAQTGYLCSLKFCLLQTTQVQPAWAFCPCKWHSKVKHGCYRWYKRIHPSNTLLSTDLSGKKPRG